MTEIRNHQRQLLILSVLVGLAILLISAAVAMMG